MQATCKCVLVCKHSFVHFDDLDPEGVPVLEPTQIDHCASQGHSDSVDIQFYKEYSIGILIIENSL